MRRAFPIVYVRDVRRALDFYAGLLDYEEQYRFPAEGDPGFVSLKRDEAELGVVDAAWPRDTMGLELGDGPRFELFVYVDDVDQALDGARAAGAPVLLEPQDMPWGERMACVADPDGNPVTLAAPTRPQD